MVETGTIDAIKSVDVKGRVTGRLAKLFVEEGDSVKAGQVIALIDPKETRLLLEQNQAQLRGAQTVVGRSALEIDQRHIQNIAALKAAQSHLAQLTVQNAIQPTLTASNILQARTALRTAEEDRIRLLDSLHPTQRASTRSSMEEAQANFDNAQSEYRRQSELVQKGFVSSRSLESAKLAIDVAKTRLTTAQVNAAKLEAQLSAEKVKADQGVLQAKAALETAMANQSQNFLRQQDVLQAQADLAKAKAALKDDEIMRYQRMQSQASVDQLKSVVGDAQRQLGETTIISPISGVVTSKNLQVGELATGLSSFSSGTTIVKIEDRSKMRVRLDVNEIDVARMSVGMRTTVDVDALPERSFHGTVTKIAPASKDIQNSQSNQITTTSSDAVVKYTVEVVINDADRFLKSGMSAKVTLDLVRHDNVLILPIEFVLREGRNAFVMVMGADKLHPTKSAVRTGPSSGSEVEIVSGISEGAIVAKPDFKGPARKGAMQFGGDDSQ